MNAPFLSSLLSKSAAHGSPKRGPDLEPPRRLSIIAELLNVGISTPAPLRSSDGNDLFAYSREPMSPRRALPLLL